jgi:hypothetical protein
LFANLPRLDLNPTAAEGEGRERPAAAAALDAVGVGPPAAQVRFCRDDLGYRGVRGAVGLGYRFTVQADPSRWQGFILNSRVCFQTQSKAADRFLSNPKPSCFAIKTGRGRI